MFNKKLFKELKEEKKMILVLVIIKVLQFLTNISLVLIIGKFTQDLYYHIYDIRLFILEIMALLIINIILLKINSSVSYKVSLRIKDKLRKRLIEKVFSFKLEYETKLTISQVMNLAVEGIEQLNIFYAQFLPQMFFALIGPLILFIILSFLNLKIALAMLLLVPLIPLAIFLVQKIAKKVVKSYWKSYTNLSDVFIDFLYGLTTLTVFNADEDYNNKLNNLAEDFREKTMKLLFVQLNNITVLDLVSYVGAGIGIILSLYYFQKNELTIFSAFSFILLSQEFFTPLRRLGSLFHVAMNGISSANSLFEVLDIDGAKDYKGIIDANKLDITVENLSFSYGQKEILENINMKFKSGNITALVGLSGSGKSTMAKIICGALRDFRGNIFYNNKKDISSDSLAKNIIYIDNNPYFFKQTLAYNLKIAKEDASDEELYQALDDVGLLEYFKNLKGLETFIDSWGNNLSGGQKQRLALARAILKKPKVLILDEAISNIDRQSEALILKLLEKIRNQTNIIIISHRLYTVKSADYIYYLDDKKIAEEGDFARIMKGKLFRDLYSYQEKLEKWGLNE